jgi:hypothetical protein
VNEPDYDTRRPTGTTIVLFHFHAHFHLCRSRVALLQRLNPRLAVFGLYGGEEDSAADARRLEQFGMTHVDYDRRRSPAWNKKNTDLAVVGWYRRVGRSVPFDRVHVVQWDLLFFARLADVYPVAAPDAVALTGLVPLAQIAHFWDWTANAPLSDESNRLFVEARDRFNYRSDPFACIGPGYSLPRAFLEGYSALDVSDTGHDELRLPLFAQILGLPLADTGFYPRWRDPDVEAVFNADPQEIDPVLVEQELAHPAGRRAFHPCRGRFDAIALERLVRQVEPPSGPPSPPGLKPD